MNWEDLKITLGDLDADKDFHYLYFQMWPRLSEDIVESILPDMYDLPTGFTKELTIKYIDYLLLCKCMLLQIVKKATISASKHMQMTVRANVKVPYETKLELSNRSYGTTMSSSIRRDHKVGVLIFDVVENIPKQQIEFANISYFLRVSPLPPEDFAIGSHQNGQQKIRLYVTRGANFVTMKTISINEFTWQTLNDLFNQRTC